MASLFSLFGEIFIENSAANKAIDSTVKQAEGAAGKTGASVGAMAKNVASGAMMVASAGVAAAGALVNIGTQAAENADAIDEGSQALGVSAEGYQEWAYILDQNGMSIDSFGTSMKGLVKTMTDGSLKSSGALDSLGLSLEDLEGMSQEDLLDTVVTSFQDLPEGVDKSKLAMDVFGKSGLDMLPVLNQAAGSLDGLKTKAHEYGMVMSDEAVASGAELGDSMATLQMAGSGLMNSLGTSFVPLIQSVVDLILDNLPMIQGLIADIAPILTDALKTVVPVLLQMAEQLLPPLLDLIQQLLPFVMQFASELFPVITQVLSALLPVALQIAEKVLPIAMSLITSLLPLLQPLLLLLQPLLELTLALLTPLLDFINVLLPPLIAIITNIVQVVVPPLVEIINFVTAGVQGLADFMGGKLKENFEKFSEICGSVGKAIGDKFGAAVTNVQDIIGKLKTKFDEIVKFVKDVFSGNWKSAWEGISKIFSDIFLAIGEIAKKPINGIIDLINSFIKGVNKIKIPDWVPEIGGKGISIATIPRLKVGMDYVPGDNFPALLHRGESVLTAKEAEEYRANKGAAGNTYAPNINITINGAEQKTARELLDMINREIADATFGTGGAFQYGTI